MMIKRGDLVKTAGAGAVAGPVAATITASDQYWYAFNGQSVDLVIKVDPNYIWVRWFGSVRSDQDTHKYYNKAKYFNLVSRNDQL